VDALLHAARETGARADFEQAARAFDRAWQQHMDLWTRGNASGAREVATWAMHDLRALTHGATFELLVAHFENASHSSCVVPLEGAVETIAALARAGVPAALVCDTGLTPGRVVRQHLARLGLLEGLRAQIFSDEVGVPKPHERVFRTALGALGVAASGAFHVGDLLRTELTKTERLVDAFIDMAVTSARYDAYLGSVDVDAIDENRERLEREIESGEAGDPQVDLSKKNLAIILKRLEKMREIRRYLDVARGQLDLIENSFQLIADNIVTMQSPQELSGQLNELLDGVESIRQTAVETDASAQRARLLFKLAVVDEQARSRLATDEDILCHRHVGRQGELLIDRCDPRLLRRLGTAEADGLASQLDRSRIGRLGAGQDLQQGRLAGTVLTKECVDLGFVDGKVHLVERPNARKSLRYAGHAEKHWQFR